MAGQKSRITAQALVENYLHSLYRYAYRLTSSAVDAEDLVQETFLIAAEKIDQLREPDLALAWLIKILRSCRARQGRRALPISTVDVDDIAQVAPGTPGITDEIDRDRVIAVMESLPDEFREPLLLFYFEEMRYREIAEALGVPIGTVMSRIARGKAFLRDRLLPEHAVERDQPEPWADRK
jgi:RNA polymerase sigma-70 factor (ECF subfamily)